MGLQCATGSRQWNRCSGLSAARDVHPGLRRVALDGGLQEGHAGQAVGDSGVVERFRAGSPRPRRIVHSSVRWRLASASWKPSGCPPGSLQIRANRAGQVAVVRPLPVEPHRLVGRVMLERSRNGCATRGASRSCR